MRMTKCIQAVRYYFRQRKEYPWRHFWRHPYLVALVGWNYVQRFVGAKLDAWYWADGVLLRKVLREKKVL